MPYFTRIAAVGEHFRSRVQALYGVDPGSLQVENPPSLAFGDLAVPVAMTLARTLRRPPRVIAAEILAGMTLPECVERASIEGAGFINLFLDRGRLLAELLGPRAVPAPLVGKVIVEHSNINPNKAAHIGHLRNAVLGDILVAALRSLGARVEVQNYIDDTGVQLADLVVGLRELEGKGIADLDQLEAAAGGKLDFYAWDLYARVGLWYAEDADRDRSRRDTLHAMEHGDAEIAPLAAAVAERIVRRHLATMARLGIRYQLLPRESDIIGLKFWSHAFALLKEKGAIHLASEGKNQGCWVMALADSEEFAGLADADKVIVRSNGTVTYVGKDIAYQLWKLGLLPLDFHYRKFHEYEDGEGGEDRIVWRSDSGHGESGHPEFGHGTRVYNVIDVRQSYLQKIVREGLLALGYEDAAKQSIHFSYEMVALTPATAKELGFALSAEDETKPYLEMSGRRGLGVKADDLLDVLLEKSSREVEKRNPELPAAARQRVASQVATAALRFFMSKYGRNKVIAFDFEEALSFEGDSGPYLQYALVRADNIFRKMRERGVAEVVDPEAIADSDSAIAGSSSAIADDGWQLILDCAQIPQIVARAVDSLELSVIARHAITLAQHWNHFYHANPILNEEDPGKQRMRIAIATLFRQELSRLFAVLGLPIPERM